MNIIKYLQDNDFNGLQDHLIIKDNLYKKDIIVSYESIVTNGHRRFIFTSSNRSRKTFINDLCAEANGLILEAPEWKVLVMPTLSPKTNTDSNLLNSLILGQKYDIYYVEDGTIINLYYYEPANKWIMSSAKGIDIGSNIFNKLSYSQMFDECLEKAGIAPNEFYESLNSNYSYTFGFKHDDIHPFQEGKGEKIYKIWFIAQHQLNGDTAPYLFNNDKISGHTPIDFPVKSVGMLFTKLKRSFDDFINYKKVNYGFLLVAREPLSQRDYSVILLESNLMNSIRRLWYDNSYVKFSKVKSFNRVSTILLNSFLDNNRMESFNILFPQYREELKVLNEIESDLTEKIYKSLTTTPPTPTTPTTPTPTEKDGIEQPLPNVPLLGAAVVPKEPASVEDDIISVLCNKVSNLLTIESHDRPMQKVRDILHSPTNIEYYYSLREKRRILR